MNNFLSQEEIDALLNSPGTPEEEQPEKAVEEQVLSEEQILNEIEQDALGEIGNISMGSAATALSQLLNQRVNITTPQVTITTPEKLAASFEVPYMVIEVNFTEGLSGSNLLVIKVSDAAIIADLMMGGDGTNPNPELSEYHTSAVGEAMNQMMGSAATSMSSIFQKSVVISPPKITAVDLTQGAFAFPWDLDDKVVVVSFKMEIGTLINSKIMQILPAPVAKEETTMLLGGGTPAPEAADVSVSAESELTGTDDNEADLSSTQVMSQEEIESLLSGVDSFLEPEPEPQPEVAQSTPASSSVSTSVSTSGEVPKNIDLILDVPLNISVILGRTKKPIKEVLNLIPGSIVELEKLAEEPVEILVNGTLIAHGEVVVVNESFGVRILAIDSPVQRLNNLRK